MCCRQSPVSWGWAWACVVEEEAGVNKFSVDEVGHGNSIATRLA